MDKPLKPRDLRRLLEYRLGRRAYRFLRALSAEEGSLEGVVFFLGSRALVGVSLLVVALAIVGMVR